MDPRKGSFYDPYDPKNRVTTTNEDGSNSNVTRNYIVGNPDYPWGSTSVIVQEAKRTSIFLIAMVVTLIVVLILAIIYLLWFLFVKTAQESPTDIFNFLFRRSTTESS